MLLPFFRRFALYNRWANTRLYAACAALPEAEYMASRKAFFGSIHRTLNHLLLVDRIWLSRIDGGTPITDPLDTELYTDFAALRPAREAQDRVIIDYIAAQTEATLDAMKSYANASGQPQATRHSTILHHYFNHQAHHRGQVHDMLSQTSVAPPPLDMIYFVREAPEAG